MRVCFLLHELGRSGGAGVVQGHARRLAEKHGFDVELLVTGPRAPLPAEPEVPVRRIADASGRYDVAVATWWETATALYAVEARRHAVFLQSFEERFYPHTEPFARLGAGMVLALPVTYIAVAGWMRKALAELRPDARCEVVRNGIDKQVFRPRDAAPGPGPLRVLVEGQPTLWFKGIEDALAAVRAMSEPAEVTLAAHEEGAAEALDADRVVGGLDAAGMARLYAESDVLLKLSRLEGLPLPPVEAMHVGVPCVVTPHTGHDEYLEHGRNGFVVGFDDRPGTTRVLDLLARDRDLLARLGEGARETARRFPDAGESSAHFAAVLEGLALAPEPRADAAIAVALRRLEAAVEQGREYVGRLRWFETGYASARAEVEQAIAEREDCLEVLGKVSAERDSAVKRLDEIRSSLPWRIASSARRAVRRGRR